MRLSPRTLDLAELGVGYGLILATLWTANLAQHFLYWIAFAWIAITAILRRRQVETHGLGLRGLVPSLWIVVAALLLALAHHLHALHPLYGPLPVLTHLSGYAVWALMQQFILQIYVLTRFLRLGLRRSSAVALSAALFALAHIPNPVLLLLTPLWGAVSCGLFLRYRNLYALAVAHGILGMTLAVTIPNPINRHMRVGLGYLEYARHPHPTPDYPSPAALDR